MTTKALVELIKDELDSQQINVDIEVTSLGVIVSGKSYVDVLLAKSELRKRGVIVI